MYFLGLLIFIIWVVSDFLYVDIAIKKHVKPYGIPLLLAYLPVVNTIIVLLNWKYLKQEKREKEDLFENTKKLFKK